MTRTIKEQLGHRATSSPFSNSSYDENGSNFNVVQKITLVNYPYGRRKALFNISLIFVNSSSWKTLYLCDLKLIATGARIEICLRLLVVFKVLYFYFIVEYSHSFSLKFSVKLVVKMWKANSAEQPALILGMINEGIGYQWIFAIFLDRSYSETSRELRE